MLFIHCFTLSEIFESYYRKWGIHLNPTYFDLSVSLCMKIYEKITVSYAKQIFKQLCFNEYAPSANKSRPLRKGTPNACVSLRILRVPCQQEIHIFTSCNPSFFQPKYMQVNLANSKFLMWPTFSLKIK